MDNTGRKTHGKSKKIISRFLIGIVVVLLVIVVGAIALFWNELRTISSITKIDDYGAYQMTYYGDYGFDEFLEVGAQSDAALKGYFCNLAYSSSDQIHLQFGTSYRPNRKSHKLQNNLASLLQVQRKPVS